MTDAQKNEIALIKLLFGSLGVGLKVTKERSMRTYTQAYISGRRLHRHGRAAATRVGRQVILAPALDL